MSNSFYFLVLLISNQIQICFDGTSEDDRDHTDIAYFPLISHLKLKTKQAGAVKIFS